MKPNRRLPCVLALLAACLLPACAGKREAQKSSVADFYPEEVIGPAERRQEIDEKAARVVALLKEEGYSCARISLPLDIAWITGGVQLGSVLAGPGSWVPQTVVVGVDGRRVALGFGPELRRLEKETLGGLRFEFRAIESLDPDARGDELDRACRKACGGEELASGGRDFISELKVPLTQAEVHKYRWLGRACAETVEQIASTVPRFATEKGVELMLADALRRRDIEPVRLWVSADDRLAEFGLAPPGERRKIDRLAAVGVTARRWGLHLSLSRMVSLGTVDQRTNNDLRNASDLVAGLWARTVVGTPLREAYAFALKGYENLGVPEMSERHPIGWTPGYQERERSAGRDPRVAVQTQEPYVWAVTVGSVTLMDTVMLVGENFELLTGTHDWPRTEARALGRIYRIPSILVR